jgi:hypothetical protein
VHPILGLLEGDVSRTLEDILGDLDTIREVCTNFTLGLPAVCISSELT